LRDAVATMATEVAVMPSTTHFEGRTEATVYGVGMWRETEQVVEVRNVPTGGEAALVRMPAPRRGPPNAAGAEVAADVTAATPPPPTPGGARP